MSHAPSYMVAGAVVHGRYRLVRLLGEGGMGSVFEAEDRELRRVCALKVLQTKYDGNDTARQRFLREAEFAASLEHEHVVRVFDRGTLMEGSPFYTMELLRGRSLAEVADADQVLPWRRVRHIGIQLCRVLSLAHDRGIVHRDLKPENCFLVGLGGDPDYLKLLDFGLAREVTGENVRLTITSEVLGTALYMSPQQARGEAVDQRCDVYAAGVILYRLLGGFHPFARANALQVIQAILQEEAPALSELQTMPPVVEDLVAKAMAKQLEQRYQSAHELLAALEAIPSELSFDAAPQRRASARPSVHSDSALAVTQAAVGPPVVGATSARPTPDVVAATPIVVAVTTPAVLPTIVRPVMSAPVIAAPAASYASGRRAVRWRWLAVAALAIGAVTAILFMVSRGEVANVQEPSTTMDSDVLVAVKAVTSAESIAEIPEPDSGLRPETGVEQVPEPETVTKSTLGAQPQVRTNEEQDKPPTTRQSKSPRGREDVGRGIDAWIVAVEKNPPGACKEIQRYRKDLQFVAQEAQGRLRLRRGKQPGDVARCASDLEASFGRRFDGWKVATGVSHPFTVTYAR